MKFNELKLNMEILKAIEEKGYTNPTPIQEQTIPQILLKKDILACAQTGTGKTAAFAIPILQGLINSTQQFQKNIKALILTPTRELAIQIRDSFRDYGKGTDLKCSVIFGGVNQASQITVLKKGVDILVATPGRLLDLIKQRHIKLDNIEYLVLDEADRMLDMGFVRDVKRVVSYCPKQRQTLLFSATMPEEIEELAQEFLIKPERIMVTPVSSTVEAIDQSVYLVDKKNKPVLLLEILRTQNVESALIFTRTKHGANKLTKILDDSGIKCAAIHGNKSQTARQAALNNFKTGAIKVLIATDIAARGIDIKELSHVINYEIPEVSETYVHRIGRTGRAGKPGVSISLCDFSEKVHFKNIERLTKQTIKIIFDHDYQMTDMTINNDSKIQKRFKSNKSIVKNEKPKNKRYNSPKSYRSRNR
jgi:Superfamily II DNA and RNA helicases